MNPKTQTPKNRNTIFVIIFVIIFVLSITTLCVTANQGVITEKLPCYDKYGSVILNQVCEKTYETFTGTDYPILYYSSLILTMISIAGVIVFTKFAVEESEL